MNSNNIRVKTITCHDVYNHGASLQAYALQRYLTEQGHEVEIIDYKPWYLSNHYKLSAISNPKFDKFLIKYLYLLAKLPERLYSLKRKKTFDQFRKKYLKLTPIKYNSFEALKSNCPEADVYIAGSDQIWNTIFQNGRDPAFYLDFVPNGKKKISYAASFATEKIADGFESFVKKMVSRIDYISVREQTAIKLLNEIGIDRAIQVCDPVFLLDKAYWSELASIKYDEKYLLVYDCESDKLIRKIAISLASILNLKIYSISSSKDKYANRNFTLAGPIEFVSLIKNANFVISNSFHGTAFSLIFEKNMCVVNRSEKINTRMQSLLNNLGIINRLVTSDCKVEDLTEKIDYPKVNKYLNETIMQSKQFLKEYIEN